MDILAQLNEQQQQAVTHEGGHQLVVAGAGTGKTRVLTYRIAWLIGQGVNPYNILALTFTKKAAKEMTDRLELLIGPAAKTVTMGTFHAVCSRFLRRDGERIGIPNNFIVYDTGDQVSLIKQLLKKMGLDPKNVNPNGILSRIESYKNDGLTPDKVELEDFDIIGQYALKLYEDYQKELQRVGALDFGDLLLSCLLMWRADKTCSQYYRGRYQYVLVDEFQDTNTVQLQLLEELADHGAGAKIFAVGDDDQSIYSWRGANPANMSQFEQYFPGAVIYKLEENYRSTDRILDAANLLIENNQQRRPKKLRTHLCSEEAPEFFGAVDSEGEAMEVVSRIAKQIKKGQSPSDFAILMRTNAQSRPFEQMLRAEGIPFVVVGGMLFFARQEVKDFLAALRLIFWPKSDADYQRVLQHLVAGVGETTINRLLVMAHDNNSSVSMELDKGEEYLKKAGFTKRAISPLLNLQKIIGELRTSAQTVSGRELAAMVFDRLAIEQSFAGDPNSDERRENIEEVMRLIAIREEEEISLQEFLTQVSLEEAFATKKEVYDHGAVTVSTIHAAKGLEFSTVFLVGMEEGLLPHNNALHSAERLGNDEGNIFIEEERRLCYVAVTRARKKLYLSACGLRRNMRGGCYPATPSRFLGEMDIELHPLSARRFTPGSMSKHVHRRLHMGGHLDVDIEDDDE